MRGSRMVQGAFRIATTSTNYMTRVIGKSVENRAVSSDSVEKRQHTPDELNMQTYWGRHIEPGKNANRNIFSIHPPFDFLVVYGINDTIFAMPPNPGKNAEYIIDKYNTGFGTLSNDQQGNHYIIEADQEDNSMRRIIDSVEIIDMQVEYNTSGQVCSEVYTFMARDAYSPSVEDVGDRKATVPTIPTASTTQEIEQVISNTDSNPY